MAEEKEELYLFLTTDENHDYNVFWLRATRVEYQDGRLTITGLPYGHLYNGLAIRAQQGGSSQEVYAWDIAYRDISTVTLYLAERMVKALQQIERRYRKMSEKLGAPLDFGQYVIFVAHSMGIEKAVWKRPPDERWGDNSRLRVGEIPDVARKIRDIAYEWAKDRAPVAESA